MRRRISRRDRAPTMGNAPVVLRSRKPNRSNDEQVHLRETRGTTWSVTLCVTSPEQRFVRGGVVRLEQGVGKVRRDPGVSKRSNPGQRKKRDMSKRPRGQRFRIERTAGREINTKQAE